MAIIVALIQLGLLIRKGNLKIIIWYYMYIDIFMNLYLFITKYMCMLNYVWLLVNPGTVTCQSPLSMRLSK